MQLLAVLSIPAFMVPTLFHQKIDFSSASTVWLRSRNTNSITQNKTRCAAIVASTLLENVESSSSQFVDVCPLSKCTPFQQLDPIEPQVRDLHNLFTGNGIFASLNSTSNNTPNNFAVCLFHNRSWVNFHFPHAMEQIYRCWSWWRFRRDRYPDEKPVLVFPISTMPNNHFLQGFSESLQTKIGLQLWAPHEFQQMQQEQRFENVVRPRSTNTMPDPINTFGMKDRTRPYFALHQIDDARQLRDSILGRRNDTLDDCGAAKPRIAILNRHKSRTWLNVDHVVQRLLPYAANEEIPVVFFENKTFIEQISFFRNVDVLLSPHGAQLTGLPFMPDCGSVLELLPIGYYFPYYFGSLALASNLQHGYVSLTRTGNWRAEAVNGMQSEFHRKMARKQKTFCPDVDVIFESALKLMEGWKACYFATKRDQNQS